MRPASLKQTLGCMTTKRKFRWVTLVLVPLMLTVSGAWSARASTAEVPRAKHHVRVAMDDGVELDGWILTPERGANEKVPTVLMFSMYFGNLDPPGNAPAESIDGQVVPREVIPAERMLEAGYALAFFNVRGSGESGGCLQMMGPRDARDGAHLVEWLADQPWSDGQVGMAGQSQDATMAMITATEDPKSLKAVVAIAPLIDYFVHVGTPNGLLQVGMAPTTYPSNKVLGAAPPVYRSPDGAPYSEPEWAPTYAGASHERICPEAEDALAAPTADTVGPTRHDDWWNDRNFADDLGKIDASVLLTAGTTDALVQGFGVDAIGWERIEASRSLVIGPWGHLPPPDGFIEGLTWEQAFVAWFDRYLKGVKAGIEPNVVRYQTDDLSWHDATSWPVDGATEAVRLVDSPRSFVSVPEAAGGHGVPHLCSTDGTTSLVAIGEEVTGEAVHITGAPFADLYLTSDQSAGQVWVNLVELEPGFSCETNPHAYKLISWGAADLQFHASQYNSTSFSTGNDPTRVRVDLEAASQRLDQGSRLAIVVSNGDAAFRGASTAAPRITVHPQSHVVLSTGGGTLGGAQPLDSYPARQR